MRNSMQPRFLKRLGDTNTTFMLTGYAVALLYALVILIPIYFVAVSSLKNNSEIFSAPLGLPQNWSLDKFFLAQERVNILGTMVTSFWITVVSEVLTLTLSFTAAYAIARIRVGASRLVEIILGTGFLIPTFAVLVPVFLLAARSGLLYNPFYLILFYAGSRLPLTIILLANHMRSIPSELEESAVIDGANRWQIMRHIFLPLSQPAIATLLVLNFIYVWNEYLFALILLSGDTTTVQLALPLLRSQRRVDYGLVAAGIVISMIPIYMVFIAFQERIVKGLMGGAVKQ